MKVWPPVRVDRRIREIKVGNLARIWIVERSVLIHRIR